MTYLHLVLLFVLTELSIRLYRRGRKTIATSLYLLVFYPMWFLLQEIYNPKTDSSAVVVLGVTIMCIVFQGIVRHVKLTNHMASLKVQRSLFQ